MAHTCSGSISAWFGQAMALSFWSVIRLTLNNAHSTSVTAVPLASDVGATRMPAVHAAAEQLAGRPACASIDPELCVALGAAVHAGVLSGDIRDGLELMDGRYSAGWHDQAYGFA